MASSLNDRLTFPGRLAFPTNSRKRVSLCPPARRNKVPTGHKSHPSHPGFPQLWWRMAQPCRRFGDRAFLEGYRWGPEGPPPSSHDSWAWAPGWVTLGTSLNLSVPASFAKWAQRCRDVPDRRRPLRRLPEPLCAPPPGRPPDARQAGPRRRPRAEPTPGACPPLRTSHPGLPGDRTSGGRASGCRTLSLPPPKVRGRWRLARSLRSTPVRTRQRSRAAAS